MATFVLVHGAWHGGWCWQPMKPLLEAHGHQVHTPTLTGQGERSHLLSAEITPDTHVSDIVQVIRWRELSDVILLGHSYGGVVVTGVAGQVPERIRALVYLDAFAPEESNVPLFAKANPARMRGFQKQIDAGAIGLEPDEAIHTWTDDPDLKAWMLARCTPQPKGTLTQGVTLTGREKQIRHRHFIVAQRNVGSPFQQEYQRVKGLPGWTSDAIPTLHDAMLEAPQDLADRLHRYATGLNNLKDTA